MTPPDTAAAAAGVSRAALLAARWNAEEQLAAALEQIAETATHSSRAARRGTVLPHAENNLVALSAHLTEATLATGTIATLDVLMQRFAAAGHPVHHARVRPAERFGGQRSQFAWECPCGELSPHHYDTEREATFAAQVHAAGGEGMEPPSEHIITVRPDGPEAAVTCSCGNYSTRQDTVKIAHRAGNRHVRDRRPAWMTAA